MSCSWCIFALHDYRKLHSILGRLLDFSRPLEGSSPAPLSRSRNERLINSAQVGKSIRIVRCISMENIQNNTKTPTGRAPTMAKEYKWSSVRSYRSVSRVANRSEGLSLFLLLADKGHHDVIVMFDLAPDKRREWWWWPTDRCATRPQKHSTLCCNFWRKGCDLVLLLKIVNAPIEGISN